MLPLDCHVFREQETNLSVLHRINQFYRACRARIGEADRSFVASYLTEVEQALFFQMEKFDQRHCLDVARAALVMGKARGVGTLQLPLLVRGALLHDIGKVRGDLTVLARSLITVLQAVAPGWVRLLSAHGEAKQPPSFAYACYVHLNHARRGAYMLSCFTAEPKLVQLVLHHHDTSDCVDSLQALLSILRHCDEAN